MTIFLGGGNPLSMAMFHSYVQLPDGISTLQAPLGPPLSHSPAQRIFRSQAGHPWHGPKPLGGFCPPQSVDQKSRSWKVEVMTLKLATDLFLFLFFLHIYVFWVDCTRIFLGFGKAVQLRTLRVGVHPVELGQCNCWVHGLHFFGDPWCIYDGSSDPQAPGVLAFTLAVSTWIGCFPFFMDRSACGMASCSCAAQADSFTSTQA